MTSGTFTNVVKAAENYVKGFEQACAAVRSIPQVGSIDDVAATAGKFREGTAQMRKARADFDKNVGQYQKQLDEMSAHEPK